MTVVHVWIRGPNINRFSKQKMQVCPRYSRRTCNTQNIALNICYLFPALQVAIFLSECDVLRFNIPVPEWDVKHKFNGVPNLKTQGTNAVVRQ